MSTNSKHFCRFIDTKPFSGKGYAAGATIRVTAELHQIGEQRPYFSVTAEIREPLRRDISACGCLHREILAHWPELAPVVDMHLSAPDGDPMHSEANGYYWLAGALGGLGERYHGGNSKIQHWRPDGSFDRYGEPTADESLAIFAKCVHIDMDAARGIADRVKNAADRKHRDAWRAELQALSQMHQQKALAAIELLEKLSGEKFSG